MMELEVDEAELASSSASVALSLSFLDSCSLLSGEVVGDALNSNLWFGDVTQELLFSGTTSMLTSTSVVRYRANFFRNPLQNLSLLSRLLQTRLTLLSYIP